MHKPSLDYGTQVEHPKVDSHVPWSLRFRHNEQEIGCSGRWTCRDILLITMAKITIFVGSIMFFHIVYCSGERFYLV
jgi:hypothetical protein